MSRACGECGRRMQDRLRHLHELEPGIAFRVPLTGRVSRLLGLPPGGAMIEDLQPGEEVTFETYAGDEVSFRRNGSDAGRCSGYTEVHPLEESP